MSSNQTEGRALDWNDTIENDGGDFTLLPEGVYPFRVTKFERARFSGSEKMPACNSAKLTIEVGDAENSTTITHNLYLHTKTEGLICAFFRAIGARKHGERVVMDWNKVVDSHGMCKVSIRKWKGKDGSDRESNEIKKFLDPVADVTAVPQQELAF